MVHLFSMSRCGRNFSVMARVNNGVYEIESINGHAPHNFPAFISKNAINRVQPQLPNTVIPVITDQVDIPTSAGAFDLSDFSL